jgi:hypothetical protein
MRQGALTVIAKIAEGREAALEKLLTDEDEKDSPLGFASVESVHFARMVLLPAAKAQGSPRLLAIETNYDGEEEDHLDELTAKIGDGLGAVLGHCRGFSGGDAKAIKRYLRDNSLEAQAFYIGHQGHSRKGIVNDRAVRDALEAALDDALRGNNKTPRAIFDKLASRAKTTRLDLDPAPPEGPSLAAAFVDLVLLGLPYVGFLLATIAVWYPLLRFHEERDSTEVLRKPIDYDDPARDGKLAAIVDTEDWLPQNPLTHLSEIKPGPLRMFALRTVLFAVQILGRYFYRHGKLGDMATIHFARWVILPDRRLLFFSNYDGSWESYLGDFIDKASKGLTAVWSNTVDYPPTSNLVFKGAKDEERFKSWTRERQVPTQLWYTAYPNRSVQNVLADNLLRRAVSSQSDAEIAAFLEML